MTEEEREMLKAYQEEMGKIHDIAQRLDSFNPEIPKAFTGTPSERIIRQLSALDIPGFHE